MAAFLAQVLVGLGGVAGLVKILTPLLAGLVGWLVPSPFQKAEKAEVRTHDSETKAQDSRGDVSGLDNLP